MKETQPKAVLNPSDSCRLVLIRGFLLHRYGLAISLRRWINSPPIHQSPSTILLAPLHDSNTPTLHFRPASHLRNGTGEPVARLPCLSFNSDHGSRSGATRRGRGRIAVRVR